MLKLIAFAKRRQPKDAFDLDQLALHYDGGAAAAIASCAAKRGANSGFAVARARLAEHFTKEDPSSPLRGAAFVFGENPTGADALAEHLHFRQELVKFGHSPLDSTS